MGLSSSLFKGNDDIGMIYKDRNYGGIIKNENSGISNEELISFSNDVNDLIDLEFHISRISYQDNSNSMNILRRGKSHELYMNLYCKDENTNNIERMIQTMDRAETCIFKRESDMRNLVLCNNISIDERKYKNYLINNMIIDLSGIKKPNKSYVGNKILRSDDLIDISLRYMCDSKKGDSLPLFPSSIYTNNIVTNPWYSLSSIISQNYIFEVPENVDILPLIGKSPNLQNLSFLECLRLSLRKNRNVHFKIIKPQIWIKPIRDDRNNFDVSTIEYEKIEEKQNYFFIHSLVYCTVIQGSINITNSNSKKEIWWNFEIEDNPEGYDTIHLPLVDSLGNGLLKLEKFLNEDHISNYIICFSELLSQFESWRRTHNINEMISLICINSLLISDYLLGILNLFYKDSKLPIALIYMIDNQDNDILEFNKKYFMLLIILAKITTLRSLSLRFLLQYPSKDFLIKYLNSRIQNISNNNLSLINIFENILNIITNDQVISSAIETFACNLDIIRILKLNCHIPQAITLDILISSILFFAEIKQDISTSIFIGEMFYEEVGSNIINDKDINKDNFSWNDYFKTSEFINIQDFIKNMDLILLDDDFNIHMDYLTNIYINSNNIELLKQRLKRVYESLRIKIYNLKITLSPEFIKFLVPKATKSVKEEMTYLRGTLSTKTNIYNIINQEDDLFGCCQNQDIQQGSPRNIFVQNNTSSFPEVNKSLIQNQYFISSNSSISIENNWNSINIGKSSFKIFSFIRSLITGQNGGIQCCNTDHTDFRNLLDLADVGETHSVPPTWNVIENSEENIPIESEISNKIAEELILDWIKLRCWNFTDTDLRWIDGCRYIGEGVYETCLMQISPNMLIEDIVNKIFQEVYHSEVRKSLRNITFEAHSPLILVRNFVVPFGELLIPNPNIESLIEVIKQISYI
ncbi:hypothetical protein cand_004850 [Cryptosporidium andersoni]|uniref:Uncharacterized protein n=1 Tax=Cryptosporidium andersoni TaxID=117008 RepID=A0A1J4MND3_9CRYT|nr:hypothetical protein cand_004850 [Cryptosporidium andersoni]